MQANNPFRNPRPTQNNLNDSRNHGERRGGYNRGKHGNFQSSSRGSFNGRGHFRGGRGRGTHRRGGFMGANGKGFGQNGTEEGHHNHSDENDMNEKEKNWGKVKFNPVEASAKVEQSTPWYQFKHDMLHNKDRSNTNSAQSKDAKNLKEQRAKENLKAKILFNQQKPTKWDDFGAEDVKTENTDNNKKNKRGKDKHSKDKSKPTQDRNPENNRGETRGEKLLQSFENNDLSVSQKNHLRKLLTKNVCLVKGVPLQNVVKDMKRQGELKLKKKNLKLQSKTQTK